MPEGFRVVSKERIAFHEKLISRGTYLQPFNRELDNIMVLGPIESSARINVKSILFPSVSPPSDKLDVNIPNAPLALGSYQFYGAANLGRGQLFPTGDISSNSGGLLINRGFVCAIFINEHSLEETFDENLGGFNILITSIKNEKELEASWKRNKVSL